ncbi:MAG: SRPBCC domain-containing protein [Proteobacteria bacterium]|nr:SRPBCC domain-containing protein [Pseudomonadota bacterium]MCP4922142.1 SRPBCC domain-containing protein [Pseudomonadota bacterium]
MRIETSIELACTVDEAWAVLGDFSTYPDWNPLTPRVVGLPEVGSLVTLHVLLAGQKMKRVHRVSRADGTALCWTIEFPVPFLMRGERCQTLTPTQTGCTFRNVEIVEGLVGPMVQLFFGSTIRASLEAVGTNLRDHLVAGPG